MAHSVPATTARPALDDLQVLAPSFKRALLAQNKSPRTVEAYTEALRLFSEFLRQKRNPGTTVGDYARARRDLGRGPARALTRGQVLGGVTAVPSSSRIIAVRTSCFH